MRSRPNDNQHDWPDWVFSVLGALAFIVVLFADAITYWLIN